ncbi:MAG: response regulator [Rhodospirillales bacterium]|nr:response regulator [Alphaproteobacteria bacterium]MCB9986176.1 response regulator [Rhodospirillales bacterium]USO07267.1 MAG: response regulator [Rhodospirillales bacterium]
MRNPEPRQAAIDRKDREHNVVLVADDNTFIRFLVKKWLGAQAKIVEVSNGADVMSAYLRSNPDMVFLDIHLPGCSGKDVLARLMQADPEAYVVMLSADSNRDNVMNTVRTGAKAFITKPFTRDTLHRYFLKCPTVRQPELALDEAPSMSTVPSGHQNAETFEIEIS